MSLIGCTIYRWGGDVEAKVRLLKPHYVVVGSGAWNDIDAIAGACAPVAPLIVMRDMTENLIDLLPEFVISEMAVVASRKFYRKVAFHLLNESYSDVEKAKAWELKAIAYCQKLHLPGTVALNGAYGNDPDDRFKDVAELSKLVGWHLYDGFRENGSGYVDRVHTSRRYLRDSWPRWWPRNKHIATEVGIEAFPATGQRSGWADMGIPEATVSLRILENAVHWKADGLLGTCWFTAGHTEQSWNEGYGMTEAMARLWGEKGPEPNTEEENMPTLDDVGEQFLKIQRTLNEAKKAASFTVQGAAVDEVFAIAGDGYNMVQEIKKARAPAPV